MGKATKQTRDNRTSPVDFRDEATYFQLLGDGKALLEGVLAFVLSLGLQRTHKATGARGRGHRLTTSQLGHILGGQRM